MRTFEKVIIVGASSGIGKALAEQLLKDGSKVAMVSRRSEPMQTLAAIHPGKAFVYTHDVTNYAEFPRFPADPA